ncbi:MAG TPA: hypothetical protein VIU11_06900 [Nakamurella sp.]
MGLQVGSAVDVDVVPVPQSDQCLVHACGGVTTFDGHLVPNADLAFLDLGQFSAIGVLEDERVTDPGGLAVDLEHPVTGLVLDPGVVPDGHQLLPHLIPVHRRAVVAAEAIPQIHDWNPSLDVDSWAPRCSF